MKFGISFFPDCGPEIISAQDYYQQALDLCAEADALQFDSVRIVEHYFHPYGGYSPSPVTFLTAASQRTRSMRLVTGCVLPVFNHPLQLATQLAMLDGISGGRLDVGVARAFLPHEFRAFQVDMNESRSRFEEGVAALKALWLEDRATFQGSFHSFTDVQCLPRVTQRPHPPFWVAVTQTPESFVWAGQQGYNLMSVALLADTNGFHEKLALYRQAYCDAGNGTVRPDQIMLGFPLYLAASQQIAERAAERYMGRYLSTFAHAASAWDNLNVESYRGYQGMAGHIASMSFKRIISERRALIGSAEHITEQIRQIKEGLGIGYLSLQIFFGGMPYQEARATLRLFAEQVMPHFADDRVPEALLGKGVVV